MKMGSIRVVWAKLEIKQEMILYLGTYPLPQSDLIFRNGESIKFIEENILNGEG